MSAQTQSSSFLAKRRLYTFLPVLTLPFVTLLYWAIGVDLFTDKDKQNQFQGLNMSLPGPSFQNESTSNKLAYYNRALRDSAKMQDLLKSDPYRRSEASLPQTTSKQGKLLGLEAPMAQLTDPKPAVTASSQQSPSQAKILNRLKTLDSVLAASPEPQFETTAARQPQTADATMQQLGPNADDLQRIQQLMSSMQDGQTEQDPEIRELSELLEKVLDIQHPERVTNRLQNQAIESKNNALSVSTTPKQGQRSRPISEDHNPVSEISFQQNGFFSLDEDVSADKNNAITAVVAENQTLVSGSVIKLRLSVDIYVSGTLIPKGSFLYGTSALSGERLTVNVRSVRQQSSLFAVNLSVYDLDGLEGIYVPGAISRDVAKQSMSQQIQALSLGSLDPSLGAQAASAGVQAAKSLLDSKNRLIQVSVTAGYQILLKDGSQSAY
jgi:conjugative transposon TraM protein